MSRMTIANRIFWTDSLFSARKGLRSAKTSKDCPNRCRRRRGIVGSATSRTLTWTGLPPSRLTCSITCAIDSSFYLVVGLRRQIFDFVGHWTTMRASFGEAVNRPIGLACTVGIVEDQACRGDSRLQFDFSRTVCSKELQPGQPPEREAFVRPHRLGRHHHFYAATNGVLREVSCVISIREGKACARRADLFAYFRDALFNIFHRRRFRFPSQNGMSKPVCSNTEATLMKAPCLFPGHKTDIIIVQVCFDAVLCARTLHPVNQYRIRKLFQDIQSQTGRDGTQLIPKRFIAIKPERGLAIERTRDDKEYGRYPELLQLPRHYCCVAPFTVVKCNEAAPSPPATT